MKIITNQSVIEVCLLDTGDRYFCSKFVILSIISIFTGCLCVGKIAKYHYNQVKCFYQLGIFYCAFLQCVFFTLHWLFFAYDVVENFGYWFRVVQLLIVCLNYSNLASRVLNATERYKKIVLPCLGVFTAYYFALIFWALFVPRYRYPHRCTEFSHIVYFACDTLLSQVFLVCGVYLTRKMAQVNMPTEQFLDQRRQLWGVIIAYEIEAVISLVYDILLETAFNTPDNPRGCGGFLYHHNAWNVIAFVGLNGTRMFLALWFMLYTFDAQSTDYNDVPVYTYEPEDSYEEWLGPRNSIVPSFNPYEDGGEEREPLIAENFENYLPPEDHLRFGEKTHRQLIIQAQQEGRDMPA